MKNNTLTYCRTSLRTSSEGEGKTLKENNDSSGSSYHLCSVCTNLADDREKKRYQGG